MVNPFRCNILAGIVLLGSTALLTTLSSAAEPACSYKRLEPAGNYAFNILNRPEPDCNRQVLRISVQHYGKPIAQLVHDPELVPESSWADDLDNDGKPELVIISRSMKSPAKSTLDIYYIDGKLLQRVQIPEPVNRKGYRGGDEYLKDGRRIVRLIPVYRKGDKDGNPSGGKRKQTYEFRNRQILPTGKPELSKNAPVPGNGTSSSSNTGGSSGGNSTAVPRATSPSNGNGLTATGTRQGVDVQTSFFSAALPTGKTSTDAAGKIAPPTGKPSAPSITSITATPDFIEILANGKIESCKTLRLSRPWRLILDIPDAESSIRTTTVDLNAHGIAKARIGRHEGFLRIVLDAIVTPLPEEIIAVTENSLRIAFKKPIP